MSESYLHKHLKRLGMAYLYNQNCFMVADEVYIYKNHGLFIDIDNHFYIDVVGISKKFISHHLRSDKNESYQHILRGIEVKISRSDFKNGFVTTGCNYHYLITPMRLINIKEIPNWIGLIEYNKHKYAIKYLESGKFDIGGLKIIRKPKFRKISSFQLDYATRGIGGRLSTLVKSNLVDLLCPKVKE